MTNFEETIRKNLLRFIVQKQIFCPITGDVLDMDTCGVFVDSDGDPAYVVSPKAMEVILRTPAVLDSLASKGLTPREG